MQAGAPPMCNGGACIVSGGDFANSALVVSLAADSYFAPGRTFVVPFPLPGLSCGTDNFCAQLPNVAVLRGAYTVSAQVQRDLLHYWLNDPLNAQTTLPVHVTYRPLWPNDSMSEAADAIAAGLPLEAVETDSITNIGSPTAGPASGPSQMFQTDLQEGNYERIIAPLPPFDRIFPPDVRVVAVTDATSGTFEGDDMNVDATLQTEQPSKVIPTFNLTRTDTGGLDGWVAYLREQTTKLVLSNVVPLSGTTATGVVLATNHFPPDRDALTNAELVLEPPPGAPVPRGVFAPQGRMLSPDETYPELPELVTFQGTVSARDGNPVEADLVFEATGIDALQGGRYALNRVNFEYAVRVSARMDGSGASRYAVALPQGEYRISIRPLDLLPAQASDPPPEPIYGVTTVGPFIVGPPGPNVMLSNLANAAPLSLVPTPDGALFVDVVQSIQGSVMVGDMRPLSGATVEAIPELCANALSGAACLPRARQTTTSGEGKFIISLDQGTYVLRVRPAEGTRLPWVWKSLVVGSAPTPPVKFLVPAPANAGLTLRDPLVGQDPVVNAIVRVFRPSGQPTTWVEIGRAITDATGHYDMYLAPQ
jgi:hypothetical protein